MSYTQAEVRFHAIPIGDIYYPGMLAENCEVNLVTNKIIYNNFLVTG